MNATCRTAQAHLRMRKTALKYDKFYFVITKPNQVKMWRSRRQSTRKVSEKHSRNKAKRQQNPYSVVPTQKYYWFSFLEWFFIEIIKYNNSVTDMQTVYRYTPLVKQAMSLRKLINVLCLTVLYRIPPGMPIGSFPLLTPSSVNMRRLSISPLVLTIRQTEGWSM